MRSPIRLLLTGLGLMTAGGCDVLSPGACPTWVRNAIEVTVRDAASGEPAAFEARGSVMDGAYIDSLRIATLAVYGDSSTALTMTAAMERPGRYEVVVRKAGYDEWRRSGVRVGSNSCGVEPVTLEANLEISS